MNMGKKEFLRNESVYVRSSVAGNPNTSGAVLAELAKDSDWLVRSSAAGNPNTSGAVLAELAKDSDWSVRRSAAGNPNTSGAVLAELAKDPHCIVRRSVAGNPNTSGAVLAELAKDSDNDVRRSAAGNPNADEPIKYKFIVTKTYVATNGTNHIWYKHNYPNIEPFYTCGCFCGSRKALISRFYSTDCCIDPSIRMRILSSLDEKFKEVFGR